MPSSQPSEQAQQEFRYDLLCEVDVAITTVREKVKQLNEREKEYLQQNSVPYRQLVNTIKNWAPPQ